MFEFLLSAAVAPFTLALGLLAGLIALELVALLAGATLLGKDADLGEALPDPGPPDPALPEPGALTGLDLNGVESADLDLGPMAAAEVPSIGGIAGALGIGRVPFLIWLAAALAGFGVSGVLLQSLSMQLFSETAPLVAVGVAALAIGLKFAKGYGRLLARLIPRSESSARPKAALSRKRGVVSQGTAREGQPAEIRVQDAFGNLHYLRAEPLERGASIAQGAEVLVLRVLHGPARGQFRIIALSD